MEEFLQENSSAVFGLAGLILGGLFTFITTWVSKNRDHALRIWDKLLERRIKAHENVIIIAIEMRIMISLGSFDSSGEIARFPKVLTSKEEFENWFTRFTQLSLEGSTWLTTKTKRELNFVQDYLVSLHSNILNMKSENYPAIGQVIRKDFVDLSSALEKATYDFFENHIDKRKLGKLSDWHKYARHETEERLMKTALLSNWEAVEAAGKE